MTATRRHRGFNPVVLPCELFPLLGREVGDLEAKVGSRSEARWQLTAEQGLKAGAEPDLKHHPRRPVLAQHVPDRPLGVEDGTERAAREDAKVEAEATLVEEVELGGGAPGHLPGVVDGDRLIRLIHLGRPPAANALQQTSQAGVGGGVGPQDEPCPVPARLDLAAVAGPAASLVHFGGRAGPTLPPSGPSSSRAR